MEDDEWLERGSTQRTPVRSAGQDLDYLRYVATGEGKGEEMGILRRREGGPELVLCQYQEDTLRSETERQKTADFQAGKGIWLDDLAERNKS